MATFDNCFADLLEYESEAVDALTLCISDLFLDQEAVVGADCSNPEAATVLFANCVASTCGDAADVCPFFVGTIELEGCEGQDFGNVDEICNAAVGGEDGGENEGEGGEENALFNCLVDLQEYESEAGDALTLCISELFLDQELVVGDDCSNAEAATAVFANCVASICNDAAVLCPIFSADIELEGCEGQDFGDVNEICNAALGQEEGGGNGEEEGGENGEEESGEDAEEDGEEDGGEEGAEDGGEDGGEDGEEEGGEEDGGEDGGEEGEEDGEDDGEDAGTDDGEEASASTTCLGSLALVMVAGVMMN